MTLRCPAAQAGPEDPLCRARTSPQVDWTAAVVWAGVPLPAGRGLSASIVVNVIASRKTEAATAAHQTAAERLADHVGSFEDPMRHNEGSYYPWSWRADERLIDPTDQPSGNVAMPLLLPDPRPAVRPHQPQSALDTRRRVVERRWFGAVELDSARCFVLMNPYWWGLTRRAGAPCSGVSGLPSRESTTSVSSPSAPWMVTMEP